MAWSTRSLGVRCAGSIWLSRLPNPASERTCVSSAPRLRSSRRSSCRWTPSRLACVGMRLLEVGQVVVDEMWKWLRWVHALLTSSALLCDLAKRPSGNGTISVALVPSDAWTVVRGRHANRQPRGHHTPGVAGPARSGSRSRRRHPAHRKTPPPSRHPGSNAELPRPQHADLALPQLSPGSAGRTSLWSRTPGRRGCPTPGWNSSQACRSGHHGRGRPGASASMAAAVVSGFPLSPLTVFGFPPVRSKDRNTWFAEARRRTLHTFTFFEAPHRIDSTLRVCVDIWAIRQICVARELTKLHEETVVFGLNDLERQRIEREGRVHASGLPGPPCRGHSASTVSDADILAKYQEISARLLDRSGEKC